MISTVSLFLSLTLNYSPLFDRKKKILYLSRMNIKIKFQLKGDN